MSQRRTRQTPRPGKRAASTARSAAAASAKDPRTRAGRPRAGREDIPADRSGITPAAVAGIGVALALAELVPRTAPPAAAARQQRESLDAEIAAVIAAALGVSQLDRDEAAASASPRTARSGWPAAPTRGLNPWAHAGRMRQMGARTAPGIRGRHA